MTNKINEDHLINSHNNSTKFKWMYIYNIGCLNLKNNIIIK